MFRNNFLKCFCILLKVACSVAFIVQISASVYHQLAPEKTVAETLTTDLENIDFPAAFKVCIKPSFNDTELSRVGYYSPYYYFTGKSKFEMNITGQGNYGWAGHREDGGVFSNASDVQNRIFQDYHSVIRGIVYTTSRVHFGSIPISSLQLRKPNYPNNCLILDVTKHLKPKERLKSLGITFRSDKFATDVDVIIEDQLTLIDRSLMYSTRKQPINYDSLYKNLTKQYLVSFEQNVFLDADKTECVNYPTDKFESYNDCDQQYMNRLLQKEYIYPAWATAKDLSKATTLTKSSGLLRSIPYFMGSDSGPCVDPCKQTSIKALYQQSDKMMVDGHYYPTVNLNFNPIVKVTTHALPSFQPLEVLQVSFTASSHNFGNFKKVFS